MVTMNSLKDEGVYNSVIRYKDFVIVTEYDTGEYVFYIYQPTPESWNSLISFFEEMPLNQISVNNIEFNPTEGEAIAAAIKIIEEMN